MTLFDVIVQIAPKLAESNFINAMWLEGSWATGTNGDQSDIDVWLDVDDGSQQEVILNFRTALSSVSLIDMEVERGTYSRSPKLVKHSFHLQGFPEPQMIELDMQEHSRGFIFDREAHVIRVIFDKNETIRWSSASTEADYKF